MVSLPQLSDDLKAALVREHYVEQNQVERAVFGKPQPASAVLRKLNVDKFFLQSADERGSHLELIFDNQNVHTSVPYTQ
ncbi:MAG: hypothetical protein WA867_18605 [Candidatus Acidiferrales bacterium]